MSRLISPSSSSLSLESNNLVDVNFTLERYDVHISTDRPIYNLEEWVFIRGVLLNGITNHPLPSNLDVTCTVKVISPKGKFKFQLFTKDIKSLQIFSSHK